MLNFDPSPTMFPGKNSPNITKSNHIFPGKGRRNKALILTYFDSPTAEVFPDCCLFFSILAIFRGKWRVKVGPKMLRFGPSLFHKNSNPSKNFQTNCLFARVLSLVRNSAILDYIYIFSVVYLTLALNIPVKIYSLIHANNNSNKKNYTI